MGNLPTADRRPTPSNLPTFQPSNLPTFRPSYLPTFRPPTYVLVDDFIGQGGTLANLRGFLMHNGARVIGQGIYVWNIVTVTEDFQPQIAQMNTDLGQ